MPFPLIPVITGAVSAAGAIAGARRKRPNVGKINAKYLGMRPEGYTTAADLAAAELQRQRGTASAARSGTLARERAGQQARARGLGGASAAALVTQGDQIEGQGRELAAEQANNFLADRFSNNLGFERNKMMTAWGGELGAANQEAARIDAQQASFWNSVVEAAPLMAGSVGALGTSPTPGATPGQPPASPGTTPSYNPSVIPSGRGPGVRPR